MQFNAYLEDLALTRHDAGCQVRSKPFGSLLTTFSIFLGLFPTKALILMIFEVILYNFLHSGKSQRSLFFTHIFSFSSSSFPPLTSLFTDLIHLNNVLHRNILPRPAGTPQIGNIEVFFNN